MKFIVVYRRDCTCIAAWTIGQYSRLTSQPGISRRSVTRQNLHYLIFLVIENKIKLKLLSVM